MSNHLEDRIALLSKDLARARRGLNWGSTLTLFVGLIAIIALCGYFGYGYKMIRDITEPENIVASAKTYMDDFSDDARQTISQEIRKSAPIWAQQASEQIVSNMPSIRERAENAIEDYFAQQLMNSEQMTRVEFKKIIDKHEEDFKEAINMMVEEKDSDKFVAKILPIIEQESQIDLKDNSIAVLGGLKELNDRLEKLAAGRELNPLEEKQRHILGITRLMREQ